MVQRSSYLPGEKAARGEIESSNRDLRLTTLCFPLEPGSERIPHDHLLGMNLSAFKFWGTTPLVLPGNSTYSICLLSFHRPGLLWIMFRKRKKSALINLRPLTLGN